MIANLFGSLTADQISTLLDVVFVLASAAIPGAAVYLAGIKKAKDELVHILDKSESTNRSLMQLAKEEGKKRALKELQDLEGLKKNRTQGAR